MRHDYYILYGDSSFSIRREFPASWSTPSAVNISIFDDGGSELLAATASTIPSATTLSAAATRGRRTITVAAGSWAPGDLLYIATSNDGAGELVRVESYNTSTKVATLRRRLKYGHTSGAAVSAHYCTYALDASGSDWSNLEEGTIKWDPNTDDQAVESTFKVSKTVALPSGTLEDKFRVAYPADYAEIPESGFDTVRDLAIDDLIDFYNARGFSFQNLVSHTAAERLILAQVAFNVAVGAGNKERFEALEKILGTHKSQFEVLRHWSDDDQDDVEEDDEIFTADEPIPNRRW